MSTPVSVFDTPEKAGTRIAEEILDGLAAAAGRRYVAGLPASRTATPVTQALARLSAERNADLANLIVVMMDDYVEQTPSGYRRIDVELPHSCLGWALREVFQPLAPFGFTRDHLLSPDPQVPSEFEEQVRALGGVDLFVLASGQSDGHVALNGPGTSADAPTRVVALADSTRVDNLSTFPNLKHLEDVPRYGVTIGTADFVRLCHSVRMLLPGDAKALAYQRIVAASGYEPEWPATIVHLCQDPAIYADRVAAGLDS